MSSRYKGIGGRKNSCRKQPEKPSCKKTERIFIPHAPVGRRLASIAEKDLKEWRDLLDCEYPLMTNEEITRAQQSFHMLLLHDMVSAGDISAAQELHTLFRKEEHERARCRLQDKRPLKDQHRKLESLAEALKNAYNQVNPESTIDLKKKIAEDAIKAGDIWIAKHFFVSALSSCRRLCDTYEEEGKDINRLQKIQAEIHCLLAFLARENNETLENALAAAIDHLAVCRRLSKGQAWQFKPKVLTIKLMKPIALHGLRFAEDEIYDIVDGCAMPIYMIATLLEHDLLISLANQIMHSHRAPTGEDVKVAHEFADHALKLALEVRQPTAMSSAFVRFGLVLRHSGAYDDALTYFNQLKHLSIVQGDYLTEGIAYHNIGLCLIGLHNSSEALDSFTKQLDLATFFKVKDLEADALYEMGHLLLQEGHLWEAEECYTISFEDFSSMEHTDSHSHAAWSMMGIAAGHKLWGRFSNLCRHNRNSDYCILLNWKTARGTLTTNHRPHYRATLISKTYPPYIQKMMPQPPPKHSMFDYEELADFESLSSDSPATRDEKHRQRVERQNRERERDEGSTDFDASQLDSDMYHRDRHEEQDEDEQEEEDEEEEEETEEEELLEGYTRYNIRRTSSSPMIGPEMFITVIPTSPPTPPSSESYSSSGTDEETHEHYHHHHHHHHHIDEAREENDYEFRGETEAEGEMEGEGRLYPEFYGEGGWKEWGGEGGNYPHHHLHHPHPHHRVGGESEIDFEETSFEDRSKSMSMSSKSEVAAGAGPPPNTEEDEAASGREGKDKDKRKSRGKSKSYHLNELLTSTQVEPPKKSTTPEPTKRKSAMLTSPPTKSKRKTGTK